MMIFLFCLISFSEKKRDVMIAMIDITPYNVIRYRKWKQSGNVAGRYEVLEE